MPARVQHRRAPVKHAPVVHQQKCPRGELEAFRLDALQNVIQLAQPRLLLRRGQIVTRETRHFVEARGVTTSSRSKEEENDYRYFPEPDLLPLRVASWVDAIELPELPDARRERFISQYGVSPEHAKTLTGGLKLAEFYETVASEDPALAATWTADYLLGELNYRDFSIDAMPAELFKELLTLVKNSAITDKSAVEILRIILDAVKEGKNPERPQEIVTRLGLAKTSGDQITIAIRLINQGARFIATNPDPSGPSENGIVPATGAMAALIEKATGKEAFFVGKPNPLMMRSALNHLGVHSETAVMIGDRMDTDIIAGVEAGMETILVLTGVTRRADIEPFPYQPGRIVDSLAEIEV